MSKLDEYLDTAPVEYMECRTFQHAWDVKAGSVRYVGGRIEWTFPCIRCGTMKTTYFSRKGRLADRRATYVYPEDYPIDGGVDKEDRAVIRITMFTLITGHED